MEGLIKSWDWWCTKGKGKSCRDTVVAAVRLEWLSSRKWNTNNYYWPLKKKLDKLHPVIPGQAAAAYPFSCLVTKLDTVAFLLLLTFHVKQVVKAVVNVLSLLPCRNSCLTISEATIPSMSPVSPTPRLGTIWLSLYLSTCLPAVLIHWCLFHFGFALLFHDSLMRQENPGKQV